MTREVGVGSRGRHKVGCQTRGIQVRVSAFRDSTGVARNLWDAQACSRGVLG